MTSVAFVSMLAEGHLRRLLPLVSGVAARGVAAHVLTHRRFARQIGAAGGRFVDLFGPYPLEDADPVSFPIAMRSVAYAARYVEDVERELEALRASLVVYDTFAMVGRLAATRMGLPYVNVCAGHNVDPPRFQQILASDPRVSVSRECLEAVERLRARYGVPDASPYSYVDGVSPYLNVYCEPPEYLRGEERAVFEPVAFFGSLPSPEEIAARDRARAPSLFGGDAALRVYVCFGTAVWRSYPSEALAALDAIAEALSRRPRARAAISLGGAEPGAQARRALARANVAVHDFVDQWSALREADVFLTHHGLNSTHEAIYHGVPMLSYPFFWDQPALAAKCQALGVARPLIAAPRAAFTEKDVHVALDALQDRRDAMRTALEEAKRYELDVIAGRPAVLDRVLALC